MKRPGFLDKLKREGKLRLVEPSEDICDSYLSKAEDCLKSSRLLLNNNLYENSVSMSYYTMYNSLTALLFRTGVKCENHSGSILLLKKLFGEGVLFDDISFAKKERIDKQYYVDSKGGSTLTKGSAHEMFKLAEGFLVNIKLLISRLKREDIILLRDKFEKTVGKYR